MEGGVNKHYICIIGCVAMDIHGNIAAGTSTGGLPRKLPGRVGDCPIIGIFISPSLQKLDNITNVIARFRGIC